MYVYSIQKLNPKQSFSFYKNKKRVVQIRLLEISESDDLFFYYFSYKIKPLPLFLNKYFFNRLLPYTTNEYCKI